MSQMTRWGESDGYDLAADEVAVSLSEVISMQNMAGGSIETTQAQTITIYGSNRDDPVGRTFVAAYTDYTGGTASSITAGAAALVPLPTECYNFRYIVLVDAGGGTVYLHRKS